MMMNPTDLRFDDFRLDVPGRRLFKGERPIELSGRYFDALVLLVRDHGQLVSKDRFFEEVWSGVVVSDSALTQCIKEIRRQLGDVATTPRYIQTVPRYGYRFVGNMEELPGIPGPAQRADRVEGNPPKVRAGRTPLERALTEGLAGTWGGGMAGLIGGLFYGGLVAHASGTSAGTLSTLAVFLSLGAFLGIAGAFGVSAGLVMAGLWLKQGKWWPIAGAALGGMLVGGVADLLGSDAFNLLFGHTLAGMTGAPEGFLLGAMLALGMLLGGGLDAVPAWRPVVGAGVAGAVAGVLIPLAGGQLFAGSLKNLLASFTGSKLRLAGLGQLFGDAQLGAGTQAMLGGVEGMLFGICVVGAVVLARQALDRHTGTLR